MFIYQLFIHTRSMYSQCYHIMGFNGLDIQSFDHYYLNKEKYCEKHFTREDAQNDVLHNI